MRTDLFDPPARILVACEFSGTVRDAFLSRGYDAWSCDLLADERGSNRHIRGDVRDVLRWGWDLLIVAHPPCTRLCKSGLRWLHTPPPGRTLGEMFAELEEGAALFSTLWNGRVPGRSVGASGLDPPPAPERVGCGRRRHLRAAGLRSLALGPADRAGRPDAGALMRLFKRAPDFVIGPKDDPYLRRWWVIPRNRWFNIYLHQILRSDDDRALHDHPWWNLSIILKGFYYEHMPCGLCGDPACSQTRVKYRTAGSLVFRRPKAAHRLVVTRSTWTLFITGPRIREWGFHCPKGWVLWTDFVAKDDHGSIGKGCGQ